MKRIALLWLCLAALTAQAADQPNVILILSDDHARQALSCYGNTDIQTPALDRIAHEGIRFEHALTPTLFVRPHAPPC